MMNDERYVRKGYKIWDTYSDREVQELLERALVLYTRDSNGHDGRFWFSVLR